MIYPSNSEYYSIPAITCPTLSSIMNGQVIFSSASPFSFGTEATYSCDDGYGLTSENRTRTCDGSGSSPVGVWSGSVPTCEGKLRRITFCLYFNLQLV